MERITFKVWKANKQAIKDYQMKKGCNKSQAINHMLRIAKIKMQDDQWMKDMEIESLPINESDDDTTHDLYDDIFKSVKKSD